jgi:hypothetical protein
MKMPEFPHHPASFRDPSGFVFLVKGVHYRQINPSYAEDYERLISSGLYAALTKKKLLLSHRELPENLNGHANCYKTLVPEQLDLITYPYEWSFDQLRDAALHTLAVLDLALNHAMILKDANPFNVQFREGKPVFIDTLSFEKYDESLPWVAYRQFCECCLFPLYLEHYSGIGVQKILSAYPEGIPAAVTARLLPLKSRLNMGVWMHVYLQNMVGTGRSPRREKQGDKQEPGTRLHGQGLKRQGPEPGAGSFSKQKLRNIIQNLTNILKKLQPGARTDSTWSNYYGGTILSRDYLNEKEKIFREFINGIPFGSALDIGANDGYFSHILSEKILSEEILSGEILSGKIPSEETSSEKKSGSVLAIDADASCMNTLYRVVREKDIRNILPLCVDIVNPTPAIGFRNRERSSFSERVRAELVVALALIHHLVFGRSLPLGDIPGYFAELSTGYLLIEFIPLEDEKVQELIRNKSRYHLPYDAACFEDNFRKYFSIEKKEEIPGTKRILYLMKKIAAIF